MKESEILLLLNERETYHNNERRNIHSIELPSSSYIYVYIWKPRKHNIVREDVSPNCSCMLQYTHFHVFALNKFFLLNFADIAIHM